ncbi:MAG TPA: Xaa-Pro peptidase family protein [Deltaproteobacteria bacterium]|nr:Xaa-Pro peptidase family protein [Deltaproteobacteria bacterium]HQB39055.1 Xaa-Pro peptidase family protein [Deltaproteobacteria bacterium]
MRLTPAAELERRYQRLQELMAREGFDAVIIVQNADLYYFGGTVQNGGIYVPVEGKPIYMVRRELGRARDESGLEQVVPYGSPKDIPARLAECGYPQPAIIGLELDVLPYMFYERYRKVYPQAQFRDATPLIRMVRMIKSDYEIDLFRDGADQVEAICQRARQVIRAGMTELELTAELELVARRMGHAGYMRMRAFNGEMIFGHAFSGMESAYPAYTDTPLGGKGLNPAFGQGAGQSVIKRGEPIVVDFSGSAHGYMVDQTRMFAVGQVSDRIRRGYDAMLKVQQRMQEVAVPGTPWGQVYSECLTLAQQLGYADSFMGAAGAQVSFIGHGVGIEIDEYPFLARGFDNMLLEEGMVFAFEPKLVFPDEGAVGIENTFHISRDGLKQLTYSSEEFVILVG